MLIALTLILAIEMSDSKYHINPNLKFKAKALKTPEYYLEGIRSQDRYILSEAITLIEKQDHNLQEWKFDLLHRIQTNIHSIRIGITGSPGVGKSTFIDSLGSALIRQEKSVAVLPVDPSSTVSKGSILGDKTRMQALSNHDKVFIRPSPSSNLLGGVAPDSKEIIHLCEGAGYDFVLMETVGVGQSETKVENLVDVLIVLLQPGSGDEIQGIKRGIMEMGDLFVVNKNDGNLKNIVAQSKISYRNALMLHQPKYPGIYPKVLSCSALEQTGIDDIVSEIFALDAAMQTNNLKALRRVQQERDWLLEKTKQTFFELLMTDPSFKKNYDHLITGFNNKEFSVYQAYAEFRALLKSKLIS